MKLFWLLAFLLGRNWGWGQTVYNYTGSNQTYTVPAGVTCIQVKMWGAGGGSGDNSNCGNGGGGAYVTGTLTVTPGQVLTLIVGQGGASGNRNTSGGYSMTAAYGGGGRGRDEDRGGGGGGGRSAILLANGTEIATAAGGGGGAGSGSNGGDGTRYCGGGGGALGGSGGRGGERNGCAQGAGGCGGSATAGGACTGGVNGAQFLGGDAENIGNQTYGGGGGGGGYYGGEGGATGGNNSGGGGGGGSYLSGSFSSTSSNGGSAGSAVGTSTSRPPAGNYTDSDNGSNYGGGGNRGTSTSNNTGQAGQNGRIVITTVSIIPTFNSFGPYCIGETPATLPTSSNNGIAGTWSPATISTASASSTNYVFTPNSNANCQTTTQISITVNNCNNFGEFASAVLIQTCNNSNTTNSYFNTTGNLANQISPTPYQSHNFGAYIQNSGQFKLQGGEMKTWKNNPGNVCGVTLYYRIYPSSSTPSGSFSAITLPFYENCNSGSFPSGGPCGGNDQKWQRPGNSNPLANVDLTTYTPNNYILEIYYDISGSHNSNSSCNTTLSVNNNGSNFTSQFSIIAPATASNTGAYCAGQNIQLNASNGGTNYQWTGPNSFTNNTQNPTITNSTTAMAGTYTVSVSTANNCPVTATTNVVVNPNPNAQITGNLNFCSGGNTTLTASGGGTYLWSPGGQTSAAISVSSAGSYSVQVTANGCSSSTSATVSVSNPPSIISISPP